MSRIDEALRRIEGVRAPGTSERAASAPDPTALERYQTEGRVPLAHEPEVKAPPLPHAAQPLPGIIAPAPRPRTEFQSIERPADAKLLCPSSTRPLLMEQFRRLAATLHDLQVERGLKTLVVTSALPREGKTLTVTNLALTLSESYGRQVLLIDADLRQPSLHNLLGVPSGAGLGEAIRSAPRAPALVQFSSHLTLLQGGQPNPNPLAALSSDRLRSLLEDYATRFEWVLLDAPPVGLLPDGLILARLTGACVFVIRANATPFDAVERAVTQLGRECIVGTVLNAIDEGVIPDTQYGEYR